MRPHIPIEKQMNLVLSNGIASATAYRQALTLMVRANHVNRLYAEYNKEPEKAFVTLRSDLIRLLGKAGGDFERIYEDSYC